MLVVLTGPVGGGKSTVARATAARLRSDGRPAAAVDLDLLFQMRDETYGEVRVWQDARHGAAALTDVFLASDTDVVIVEGGFFSSGERDELLTHLVAPATVVFVTLVVSLEIALGRVQGDVGRTFTKEPATLRWLHDQFDKALPYLAETSVVIDVDALTVDEVVGAIIRLLPNSE